MRTLLRTLLLALALAFAPAAFAQRDPEKPINIPLAPAPVTPIPAQPTPERGVPALQSFVAACSAILVMVIICYPSRKM